MSEKSNLSEISLKPFNFKEFLQKLDESEDEEELEPEQASNSDLEISVFKSESNNKENETPNTQSIVKSGSPNVLQSGFNLKPIIEVPEVEPIIKEPVVEPLMATCFKSSCEEPIVEVKSSLPKRKVEVKNCSKTRWSPFNLETFFQQLDELDEEEEEGHLVDLNQSICESHVSNTLDQSLKDVPELERSLKECPDVQENRLGAEHTLPTTNEYSLPKTIADKDKIVPNQNTQNEYREIEVRNNIPNSKYNISKPSSILSSAKKIVNTISDSKNIILPKNTPSTNKIENSTSDAKNNIFRKNTENEYREIKVNNVIPNAEYDVSGNRYDNFKPSILSSAKKIQNFTSDSKNNVFSTNTPSTNKSENSTSDPKYNIFPKNTPRNSIGEYKSSVCRNEGNATLSHTFKKNSDGTLKTDTTDYSEKVFSTKNEESLHQINKTRQNLSQKDSSLIYQDDRYSARMGEYKKSMEFKFDHPKPEIKINSEIKSQIPTKKIVTIEKTDLVSRSNVDGATQETSFQHRTNQIEEEEETNEAQEEEDSFDLDFSRLAIKTPVKKAEKSVFATPSVQRQPMKIHYSAKKADIFTTPFNPIRYEKKTLMSCDNVINRPKPLSQPSSRTVELNTDLQQIKNPLPANGTKENHKIVVVNNVMYQILNTLGKGGSSEVYQCLEMKTNQKYAIKCVDLSNPVAAAGYMNEVNILKRLQKCDKIIKMFGFERDDVKKKLYVVLEKGGDDLSTILKQLALKKSHISMHLLLFYWMEMLYAVKEIHQHGIIHSDLKPANFIQAEGGIKLIDFGIATCVQNDMTSAVKMNPEGSCNYISPEALNNESSVNVNSPSYGKNKFKLHYKSDVWSLGCILYQLVYCRTPFQHITQMWPKLAAILNPNHKIEYPDAPWVSPRIINTIKRCLQFDNKKRPPVEELIKEYEQYLLNN